MTLRHTFVCNGFFFPLFFSRKKAGLAERHRFCVGGYNYEN